MEIGLLGFSTKSSPLYGPTHNGKALFHSHWVCHIAFGRVVAPFSQRQLEIPINCLFGFHHDWCIAEVFIFSVRIKSGCFFFLLFTKRKRQTSDQISQKMTMRWDTHHSRSELPVWKLSGFHICPAFMLCCTISEKVTTGCNDHRKIKIVIHCSG